jgi:hypothetical protein
MWCAAAVLLTAQHDACHGDNDDWTVDGGHTCRQAPPGPLACCSSWSVRVDIAGQATETGATSRSFHIMPSGRRDVARCLENRTEAAERASAIGVRAPTRRAGHVLESMAWELIDTVRACFAVVSRETVFHLESWASNRVK